MNSSDSTDIIRICERRWDVIVIGGGPAGSFAARALALTGAQVLLLDKRTHPRPKVCGACLNPRGIDVLLSAGIDRSVIASGEPLESLRLGMAGKAASFPLPGGIAIARSILDHALLNSARDAGVFVLEGVHAEVLAASPARVAGDGLLRTVKISRTPFEFSVQARAVVVASGLNSDVGLEAPFKTKVAARSKVGTSASFRSSPRITPLA